MTMNPEIDVRIYRPETGSRSRITAFHSIEFSMSLEAQSGVGSLILPNMNEDFYAEDGSQRVTRGDYVMIHLRDPPTGDPYPDDSDDFDDVEDLFFIGRVQSIKDNFEAKNVELNFVDATFELLTNSFSFSGEGTSPELIETLIADFSGDGSGNSRIVLSDTIFPSTRPDGSAFPEVNYAATKRVGEMLAELLQPFSTNTTAELQAGTAPAPRPYYFYITPRYDNNLPLGVQFVLNVTYPDQSDIKGTIDLRSDSYISFSVDDSNPERVTAVIWTAGVDLNGNTVSGLYFNPVILQDGRVIQKPFVEVSAKRFSDEVRAGNLIKGSSGNVYRDEGRYDTDSFPLTTSWGSVVNNFDEYNDSFKQVVSSDASKVAAMFVTHRSFLSYQVKLAGSILYNPGNFVIVKSLVGAEFRRRVTGVRWVIDAIDGFSTELELEEDRQPVGVVS